MGLAAVSVPPVGLRNPARGFQRYLRTHPEFRDQIHAPKDETVAYVGSYLSQPAWHHLLHLQLSDPKTNNFYMLSDILRRIAVPNDMFAEVGLVTGPAIETMLDYVNFITGDGGRTPQVEVPWDPDGFVIWRTLSGISMSNATGRVRLLAADVPNRDAKIFFRTEVFVLSRNPGIDEFSKAALDTLRGQIRSGAVVGQIELI